MPIKVDDLSPQETGKLLRVLANGIKRMPHIHVCACGAQADTRKDPKSLNGWQTIPFDKCPCCLEADRQKES